MRIIGLSLAAAVAPTSPLDHAGRFALRPQVEYFGFRANGATYNTVHVCVGLVFRIGRR